jgi:DNA-binding GntR family transcriptional regulator
MTPHSKSTNYRPDQSAPERVRRTTVTGQVLEVLREKIVRGVYREGAPLRQDALAEELGVSRIPIREALRQLQAEGLVTFSPHIGAVVSTLSLDEIEELFDVRAVLESDQLKRAIPRMTDDILARADEILDSYEAAFVRHDVPTWGKLNWQFHATLLAPADRPLTLRVLDNLHNQSDRYVRMQLALTHGDSRANEEHRSIADAVRRRDTRGAPRLLSEHIVSAGERLREFLRVHRGGDQ